MKKTIAIFVMLAVVCSSFAFSVSAEGAEVAMPTFEDILAYQPPSGTTGCTNSRLLYEGSGTIPLGETDSTVPNPTRATAVIINTNPAVHQWGQIPIKSNCNYRVEASGTTVGEGSGRVLIYFGQNEIPMGTVAGPDGAAFYWNPEYGIPQGVAIAWTPKYVIPPQGETPMPDGNPSLQYNFKIYEECPCSLPALYPKVDIEQFSVAGGDTIIRDGKLLSNFEIAPGVQQTFIQVENRGFFTQNDARVKLIGLPQGVTVKITPETQKLKAHNIGTYSAEFTVDSNVPSGTYDVTLVAYSPTGTFDIIPFKFVVP